MKFPIQYFEPQDHLRPEDFHADRYNRQSDIASAHPVRRRLAELSPTSDKTPEETGKTEFLLPFPY